MEKHTVLVSKGRENHEEIRDAVEAIINEIAQRNGMWAIPYTENKDIYQFEYIGSMIDGLPCMAAGAMIVS